MYIPCHSKSCHLTLLSFTNQNISCGQVTMDNLHDKTFLSRLFQKSDQDKNNSLFKAVHRAFSHEPGSHDLAYLPLNSMCSHERVGCLGSQDLSRGFFQPGFWKPGLNFTFEPKAKLVPATRLIRRGQLI